MQLRRILLIILAVFIFMGVVAGAGTYTIAARSPFLPGDWLFPAQVWSEQTWSLTFNEDPEQQAAILLAILERRLDDWEALQGSDDELLALNYVDAALNRAVLAIDELPAAARAGWEARLLILSERALALMEGSEVVQDEPVDTAVATLIARFEAIVQNPASQIAQLPTTTDTVEPAAAAPETSDANTNVLTDARTVPFLQGNINHSFFPLQSGHNNIQCETCHTSGDYEATDSRCIACHAQDDEHDGVYGRDCTLCHEISAWQNVNYDHNFIGNNDCAACHNPPANHFEGACRDCHSDTSNFRNASFDHSRIGGQDCSSCHTAPQGHYAGACAACHSDTSNFRNAFFNHSTIGGQDCAACHNPPQGHYTGACRDCHSDTSNFRNASFNHSSIGGQDCSACHNPPQGHYSGACRDCHSDTGNFRNASFNHSSIGGQDCSSCHNPPQGHYAGSCKTCHQDTNNFRNASFSHANIGGQDCSTCHNPPQGHYAGSCKTCHQDTNNFRNARFSHANIGGQDCSACHNPPQGHYSGACTSCHQDTNNFRNASFSHANIGGQDCSACHNPPNNHYPGACTACHQDTGSFRNANFSHNGLTDCQSCHARPSNHFQGQCSDCHNTNNWGNASFNHTFPINHKGANGECAKCHPGGDTANYTCSTCHDYNKMDREHDEENNYSHNCVACHANGKDPDD